MKNFNLLDYKQNVYSQNGEDGIIEKIFSIIGIEEKKFCEFGAWDGIHFSNCRNLALKGWGGLFIEGNKDRFIVCQKNYHTYKKVKCINAWVDSKKNNLELLSSRANITKFDLLSIDIDGLDYEIFESLSIKPRVICIEVNAGHKLDSSRKIERHLAKNNIGQSLVYFTKQAKKMGYSLTGYTGNAFYVHNSVINAPLKAISPKIAYMQFLACLNKSEKEWLYLVNQGVVPPYYRFGNHNLSSNTLGISKMRKLLLLLGNLNVHILR